MREPGYYWVKCGPKDNFWQPLLWQKPYWEDCDGQQFNDGDLAVINETRILNPDEVQYIAQSTE